MAIQKTEKQRLIEVRKAAGEVAKATKRVRSEGRRVVVKFGSGRRRRRRS